MTRDQLVAIQAQRAATINGRAHHPNLRGWRTLAYCKACDAQAEIERQRARFGATANTLTFRTRAKNPPHSHIPAETVQLGHALDLTTQFRDVRTTWDFEIRDWIMLTDANAMNERPGKAALYLVRGTLASRNASRNDEPREDNGPDDGLATAAFTRALKKLAKLHAAIAAGENLEIDVWRRAKDRAYDATRYMEPAERDAAIQQIEALRLDDADAAGRAARQKEWSEKREVWREQQRAIEAERRRTNPPPLADFPEAAATYERWHEREPERVNELEIPDLIGVYIGRAMRIGYRSDKWNARGKTVDYDHDFAEGQHIPPEVWSDTAELEHARALVIVGGDMRITERGID